MTELLCGIIGLLAGFIAAYAFIVWRAQGTALLEIEQRHKEVVGAIDRVASAIEMRAKEALK